MSMIQRLSKYFVSARKCEASNIQTCSALYTIGGREQRSVHCSKCIEQNDLNY